MIVPELATGIGSGQFVKVNKGQKALGVVLQDSVIYHMQLQLFLQSSFSAVALLAVQLPPNSAEGD